MPRIKRWFPVSHDINADAEVWAMRRQIGEKSLSIWLEFLSIADRNEGQLPGDLEELLRLVSGRCQAAQRTVRGVYEFALRRLWLTCESTPKITNYWKYHRRPEHDPVPSETDPTETDRTSERTDKNQSQISPSAGVSNNGKKRGEKEMGKSMELIPELKIETDRLYASDPEKFKRIAVWVAQGRKHRYSETVMAEALRQFWDYRMVDEWYPYLDTILTKVEKNGNRDEHEAEHRRHNEEVREASKMFLLK